MKIISKFQKFMYGRYGVDDLYKFILSIFLYTSLAGINFLK